MCIHSCIFICLKILYLSMSCCVIYVLLHCIDESVYPINDIYISMLWSRYSTHAVKDSTILHTTFASWILSEIEKVWMYLFFKYWYLVFYMQWLHVRLLFHIEAIFSCLFDMVPVANSKQKVNLISELNFDYLSWKQVVA